MWESGKVIDSHNSDKRGDSARVEYPLFQKEDGLMKVKREKDQDSQVL